ncbi:MAG TPA: hypothetical protein VG106_04595, partial [Vicinamibacterales bacterium]|nr:hypothetical protein [Vicinamibacterales bacterium]
VEAHVAVRSARADEVEAAWVNSDASPSMASRSSVTYGLSFTRDAPEAYETLLLDAMLGDASLFTRADEVEAAWGIVTPIIEQWHEWDRAGTPDSDMCFYEAGSWGPDNADQMIERDNRRWRRL